MSQHAAPNEDPAAGSALVENEPFDRYRRQRSFAPFGSLGQSRLAKARVAIVGLGALGSMIAERLARAGVGSLRLIDRDWVEWDNLPRQTLYDESDAQLRLPKAVASAKHIRRFNRHIQVDAHVSDLTPLNANELLSECDLLLDGTDNFETRYLINDYSLEASVPWIHGGCVGAHGQGLVCIPGETACFRCLMPEPMPPEQQATCDSEGVLGPAVGFIVSWQAVEALKILAGKTAEVCRSLLVYDLWNNEIRYIKIEPNRFGDGCPACKRGLREFLSGERFSAAQVLCGRNAVQLQNPGSPSVDLQRLALRLEPSGKVTANAFLLRFECSLNDQQPFSITVFRDGRGIVAGTEDPALARKLFATWIGQ